MEQSSVIKYIIKEGLIHSWHAVLFNISVSQFVNKIRNRNLARTYRSTGPTANTQITELIKVFYTI